MDRSVTALVGVCAFSLLATAGPAAAASGCPNADATPDDVSVSQYADSLLCVVNETRGEWGRSALASQRNLTRASQWQADDMDENDYFSHTAADGDTLADRLDRAHFIPRSDRWGAGENLAAGRAEDGTPDAIVSGWMNSREHRYNLLDPGFTLVGIGVARGWPQPGYADDDSMTIAMDLGWRRR